MMLAKTPLILTGQLYLHEDLNEYIIVTKNNKGTVTYRGDGFTGSADGYNFIERFQPVDPEDVEDDEIQRLLSLCPDGTSARIGYIIGDNPYDEE